ncbi:MAG: transcriptional regulator [Phototrophicales bacterium]|nr:MAG: transcriptional regulator [Phototrophicales bacterium]RMG76081.1 MAG: transcriptional regulator [Chloroflexota bacterium]
MPMNLKERIKGGRSATLDWLDENTPIETIVTIMTAMANSQGGVILVGVAGGKRPSITGVENDQAVIDRLIQAALRLDPPLITPMPQVIEVDNRKVIYHEIPSGMPHIYHYDGRYLQRDGTINAHMTPREIHRLLTQRGVISFEMEPVHHATLTDLDWDKVQKYVHNLKGITGIDEKDVLLQRGCLIKQDNQFIPTNAGILLFGKAPQQYIRGSEITAVRFAGEAMSDRFNRQDIGGTLPDQIRIAELFLIDNLRKGVKLQNTMTRSEQFEYPMEAAREVVVNAVAHRDYSIAGSAIQLFLFRDRMEVSSPGLLPGHITLDNIRDERFSRNPVIVQVLSDMGFIERLGYGIDRMIDLMRENNLREPEFTETAGGFKVCLYNQGTEDISPPSVSISHDPSKLEILRDYAHMALNPRQEHTLLHLLKGGHTRITNSELQRMFPDVHPETIRRDLADLVNKDILNKMGQKRGSYYVLKRDVD